MTAPGPGGPGVEAGTGGRDTLGGLAAEITSCRACPRLVEWRERIGSEKRAAFADQEYWARPVPGFGDAEARICVVGLAPAAHGANRTGRMFTGDRSGDFLYAALWRAGLANQPGSVSRDDGLVLNDVWITAPVRCAPPANKPTGAERDTCRPFLARELALLPRVRVFVPLGRFGFDAVCDFLGLRPRPRFGHGVVVDVPDRDRDPDGDAVTRSIVASFHVSQQNTFTGRLTPEMFDEVLAQARELSGLGRVRASPPGSPAGPRPGD